MNYRVPKRTSGAHKVCAAIHKHGSPVTFDQGLAIHGYTGAPHRSIMQSMYGEMVKSGYLLEEKGTYRISKVIKRYFDSCEKVDQTKLELVQKRTNLSRGEMPVQKRDPRIRADIFYKTVGGV